MTALFCDGNDGQTWQPRAVVNAVEAKASNGYDIRDSAIHGGAPFSVKQMVFSAIFAVIAVHPSAVDRKSLATSPWFDPDAFKVCLTYICHEYAANGEMRWLDNVPECEFAVSLRSTQ